MQTTLIAITNYCTLHDIDRQFLSMLQEEGLINLIQNEEGDFIDEEQLNDLELYTRWHHELGLEPSAMDVIRHLVDKMRDMHSEIEQLKRQLSYYEAITQQDLGD